MNALLCRTLPAAALLFGALAPNASCRQIELSAAVKTGAVSMRVEFLGGAMGDRMKVFVRKQVAGEINLTVTPGTIFVPRGGDVQRLAAVRLKGELTARGTYRRAASIQLDGASEKGFLVAVVCIDYHKNSPPAGQSFGLGGIDVRCQRILSAQVSGDVSIWAYQSAIWMDRSGVSSQKLQQTFQVSTADIQMAGSLLKTAEKVGAASLAEVSVSAEAKVAAEGVFSSSPQVRAEAHARVQTLAPADRLKIEALLKQNVLRGGKLPSAAELRAGNTLQSLIPSSIELPKLELPESVDQLVAAFQAYQKSSASDEQSGARRLDLSGVLPHLTALKARFPILRIAAVNAIALVKSPLAVDALLVALRDDHPKVRSAAAKALARRTGQDFGEDAQQWTEWWQENGG